MSAEKVNLDADQAQRCRVAHTRLARILHLDITAATDNELMVMVAELTGSLRDVLRVLDDLAEVPR
jgi:hypothetical protein